MNQTYPKYWLWILVIFLLGWIASSFLSPLTGSAFKLICLGTLLFFAVCSFLLCREGIRKAYTPSLLAVLLVFCAGLLFILKLPYNFSWHDLGEYAITDTHVGNGHLGYIRWIVERGLPLMNPMTEQNSVLYHPPFSHLLYALFIKANSLLGLSEAIILENLQVITLTCAVSFACAGGMLARELDAKESTCALVTLFCGFTPITLLLGATPNNDIPLMPLTALCAVYTLRWLKHRDMKNILRMALTLGLSMATKLNAALLIPCIAAVFIIAFVHAVKERRHIPLLKQYGLFLLLSVPEAIAWPMYHLLAYQMPLNYVRLPAETQNVGKWSLWQRFGFPDGSAIRKLFYSGIRKTDHNVWMQTLKTALFDEQTLFAEGTWQWYAAYLFMVFFAVLLLMLLICLVVYLTKKQKNLSGLFLGLFLVIHIVSYLKFCLDYPNMCSFNFRYLMSILPILGLGMCLCEHFQSKVLRLLPKIAIGVLVLGVCGCYGMWFFSTIV